MASVTRTVTHRTIDVVPGPGRQVVRVAVELDESGSPVQLVMSHGFGTGSEFTRPTWCSPPLVLPGSAIPELRDALARLEAGR